MYTMRMTLLAAPELVRQQRSRENVKALADVLVERHRQRCQESPPAAGETLLRELSGMRDAIATLLDSITTSHFAAAVDLMGLVTARLLLLAASDLTHALHAQEGHAASSATIAVATAITAALKPIESLSSTKPPAAITTVSSAAVVAPRAGLIEDEALASPDNADSNRKRPREEAEVLLSAPSPAPVVPIASSAFIASGVPERTMSEDVRAFMFSDNPPPIKSQGLVAAAPPKSALASAPAKHQPRKLTFDVSATGLDEGTSNNNSKYPTKSALKETTSSVCDISSVSSLLRVEDRSADDLSALLPGAGDCGKISHISGKSLTPLLSRSYFLSHADKAFRRVELRGFYSTPFS